MIEALRDLVEELGEHLLTWRSTNVVKPQSTRHQLKTTADDRASEFLRQRLATLDSSIPFVSEEDTASQSNARPEKYWLVDPIDGTASYTGGFDGFVTQVALMQNGSPALAAIRAPALDETFLAEVGGGSTCNGRRLKTLTSTKLDVLIDNYPQPRGLALQAFEGLEFSRYVECGGISLKICRIADGTADLFFKDVVVRDWDIAAPALVLQEAGGTITLFDESTPTYDGEYERHGLIAAHSLAAIARFSTWNENQNTSILENRI
jgi:3'(2'), 5'-bisphosphate nucleotidase